MLATRFHESWITNFHEYFSQSERVLFACLLKPSRLILIGQWIEEKFGISDRVFVKPCAGEQLYYSRKTLRTVFHLSKLEKGDEKSKKYQKFMFSLINIIALSCFKTMSNSNKWVIFKIKIVMLILQLFNSPLWMTV